MDFDEVWDDEFTNIKKKLNKDKIKLWLPPFVKNTGKKSHKKLKELADLFSRKLDIPRRTCIFHLEKLQVKGINNARDRHHFITTGEASVKIKFFYDVGDAFFNIKIPLTRTGYDLKMIISRESCISAHRIKLIFRGKFLQDELDLQQQNVKHGLYIVAVTLKENCEVFSKDYDTIGGQMSVVVADIELLTKNGYFKGKEQCKKLSELPMVERNRFIRGMKLQYLGRAAVKKKLFPTALVFLLEAEENFSKYDSSLLNLFDNYGLLNIDIVWCYMNMQVLILLPDADERLYQCEHMLKEVYGEKFERVDPNKDTSWVTLVLIARLHLLQAAVLFIQHKTYKAKVLFKQTERELKTLDVDNHGLSRLTALGYREIESRFAIKEAKGDVNKAISNMEKRRTEMVKRGSELLKAEKYLKKQEEKAKRKKTPMSEADLYEHLVTKGCSDKISKLVLEHRRTTDEPEAPPKEETTKKRVENRINPEYLKTIIKIGFQPKKAKAALIKHGGDFDSAIMDLFENEFILGNESYMEIEDEDDNADDDATLENVTGNDGGVNDNAKQDGVAKVERIDLLNDEVVTEEKPVGNADDGDFIRPLIAIFQQDEAASLAFLEGTEKIQYDYVDTGLTLEFAMLDKYQTYIYE